MAFLRSACQNYKLRFDDQILIYAQRPDATAVLEIEKWNKSFGRWVNKGARGIAVFDDDHNGAYRLKHYFDISDTHGSRFERPVPVWQMRPEYESEVTESLQNSFGELADSSDLAAAIFSAAANAVEDNMGDYLRDLLNIRKDSFLEELDELNVEVEYRETLTNSVAYMLLTRCGMNADEYFEPEDFRGVIDFNTRSAVNALGLATSGISEMCLREIANTVLNLQKQEQSQNRAFPNRGERAYNVANNIKNDERSRENDRSDRIPSGGRLSNPEPDRAGGAARSPWQIRVAPKELPEEEPPRTVPELSDGGDAQRAPDGDRTDSQRAAGTDNSPDGAVRGRNGGTESPRPNEMGGADEQHHAVSGGGDTGRTDIRIKPLLTSASQLSFLGETEPGQTTAEQKQKPGDDVQNITDSIMKEYLMEEGSAPESELDATPEPYIPQESDRYEIQGRFFVVDKVDTDWETVSLRDVTFEGNVGKWLCP
jgi:hypothetical protein